jgi:hypothetical protein
MTQESKLSFLPITGTFELFFMPEGAICKLGQPHGSIVHIFSCSNDPISL